MPALIALALSVGVLAVVDTWLFVAPLADFLPGLVWISFIAWGCHFHSGGGVKGSTTAIVGMSFGALVGMVAVILATGALAGLGDFAAPVAVGLGAAKSPAPASGPPASMTATMPTSAPKLMPTTAVVLPLTPPPEWK